MFQTGGACVRLWGLCTSMTLDCFISCRCCFVLWHLCVNAPLRSKTTYLPSTQMWPIHQRAWNHREKNPLHAYRFKGPLKWRKLNSTEICSRRNRTSRPWQRERPNISQDNMVVDAGSQPPTENTSSFQTPRPYFVTQAFSKQDTVGLCSDRTSM